MVLSRIALRFYFTDSVVFVNVAYDKMPVDHFSRIDSQGGDYVEYIGKIDIVDRSKLLRLLEKLGGESADL